MRAHEGCRVSSHSLQVFQTKIRKLLGGKEEKSISQYNKYIFYLSI